MKAVFYSTYGDPGVLEYGDQPEPKVGPDTVLIEVKAASVNPVDWKVMAGYLDGAITAHFPAIPGWDVSGVVLQPGPAVPEFSAGDEVMGYVRMDTVGQGTFAERVAAPVRTLSRKPANLSWAEAATVPLTGLTALQTLDALDVSSGDTVLIHNGAGGVGTFAIQIARARGARVIASASERNHDFLRELGAEPVTYGDGIAGRVREIAPDGVSAVVDFVGGDDWRASLDVLTRQGRVASIADADAKERGGRYVFVRPVAADLATLADLIEAGEVKPVLAETYPLERAADAFAANMEGHTRGKIAITVG
ncbi:NADP-dependent oxidoreductase [Arthrobacter tumbae]|uniref:NADP-dependent oxidoreductase n=1 Tax=Arthrobacter tumbae TaxID=163874 RepID=UPI00195919BC|nr:NADP-dependent oxidoreductase [Arthrobacter tumbae]MBM7781975.1 NADPH:quinone reductase-like Zn-dependent oxidoreductase [Arthrobacter tumbae]